MTPRTEIVYIFLKDMVKKNPDFLLTIAYLIDNERGFYKSRMINYTLLLNWLDKPYFTVEERIKISGWIDKYGIIPVVEAIIEIYAKYYNLPKELKRMGLKFIEMDGGNEEGK